MKKSIAARNMQTQTPDSSVAYVPRKSNWTSVRLLNVYRLGLSSIFFSQSFIDDSPLLIIFNLGLFSWTSFAFVVLSLIWMLAAWIERRGFQNQVILQISGDIIILVTLMHACGGIASGLGNLLIIPMAMGAMLTRQNTAITFASIATLGLLAEYIYSSINLIHFSGSSTQVGILGATLFATAIITHHLITRLQSSEQLVQEHRREMALLSALNQEIIDNLQAGVMVLTLDYKIHHINQAALNLLDIKNVTEYDFARDNPKLLSTLEEWSQTSQLDTPYLPSETGIENIQVSFRRLEGQKQQFTMIFINDVTSIRSSMQQAKLASLGHLTASIAHEIRNPLGAISYAAQLLSENTELEETEKRMTQIIHQHSDRINHIIEDILKISRGSATAPEAIDLTQWINRFVEDFCLSEQSNKDCFIISNTAIAPIIKFDAGHLEQILTNLCHNARIHGRSESPIKILVKGAPNQRIAVEIADSGPGIDSDNIDKIFEPFFTTSHQGSGLGLYIVSQLCELNDASISARQNEYNGTSFIIHARRH